MNSNEKKEIKCNELYKLPWTKNDNPNGWLEITTYCNISCPGCYNGCDRKDNKPEHKSFEKIKEEILLLQKIRNCDTISISGGEPLMHPQIIDTVNFIKESGMKSTIFTNGTLLNKDLLSKLKEAGLNSLNIHVDSLSQKDFRDELSLNEIRKKYVDLVYSIGDIQLSFICVVNKKNISQMHSLIRWVQGNGDKIKGLILILMRQVVFDKKEKIETEDLIYLDDLNDAISSKIPDIKYNCFLGSECEDLRIRWVFSFWVVLDKRVIGYLDNKLVELAQSYHHFRKNKYFFIADQKDYSISLLKILFFAIINKSMRKILKNYCIYLLKNPFKIFKKAKIQTLTLVQPPGFIHGKRDFCDGCPDATIYNSKLYPSCMLEEIRRFGSNFEIKRR